MLFQGWLSLFKVVFVGVIAYLALIFLLRSYGKRTLAKMNAFDFVINIAIGSTLATIILSPKVVIIEGMIAFVLLFSLQYVISYLSLNSKQIRKLIKGEARLLFHDGEFLRGAMKSERITEEEILQTVRNNSIGSLSDVEAIVLETDGEFSVIPKSDKGAASILSNVSKK
ncbi:MAG: DUF421 domain-containing protein [Desulfobacterales bacterium]